MNIVKRWTEASLILRIVLGLVIGAILGFMAHAGIIADDIAVISMLGTLFVGALKAIAPVLVFFLVISALSNAKAPKSMRSVIILYVASTLIAGVVSVAMSYAMPSTITFADASSVEQAAPSDIGTVIETLLTNCVTNPVLSLTTANYLGILVWSIFLGIALRAAATPTRKLVQDISDAVLKVVRGIIQCAPFGIIGLVYDSVVQNGASIFIEYGHIIAVLLIAMAIIAFITNPLLAFLTFKKNPYPLVWRCLKDSAIYAFFTRSSAANIPVNMNLCRSLGLNRDIYAVSIPLGATINMAGACVTITVMTMACANTLGISIDPIMAIILCVLAAVSACGASGVPGGSLLLIPMCCSLFGISNDIAMQVVAVGFIIGVIQDSCETALNSSSDALFTASADYREMRKKGLEINPGKDTESVSNDVIAADYDPMNPTDHELDHPAGTVLER